MAGDIFVKCFIYVFKKRTLLHRNYEKLKSVEGIFVKKISKNYVMIVIF